MQHFKKVLFLHGWSSDGGTKSAFMRSLGYDVMTPRLSDWSFTRAVQTAQAAFAEFHPAVIVGASRGGAVAMNMDNGDTPLILMAPAWKQWGKVTAVNKPNAIIVHSRYDQVVPFEDTIELCMNSPGVSVIPAGVDHRLNDPQARKALKQALCLILGCNPRQQP